MIPLLAALLGTIAVFEKNIYDTLIRSPTFHRGVQKIHRTIQDMKHGRDPNEPLRPGEATEDPNVRKENFLKHFVQELRNQARGTPTDPPPLRRPPKK